MKSSSTMICVAIMSVLFLLDMNAADNDIKFIGKADIIPYLDGRDFTNETSPEFFTSMKFRLGAEKTLGDDVEFRVVFQDSRSWGEEKNPTANSKNVDLIQGWVKYKNIFGEDLTFLLGRYQVEKAQGFVIGTSPWNYIERAYDGAYATYKKGIFSIDMFYAMHTATVLEQRRAANPTGIYAYPEPDYKGYNLAALWADAKIDNNNTVSLFGISEFDARRADSTYRNLFRYTTGILADGKAGNFAYYGEFDYQFGKQASKDISAFAYLVKLTYKMNPWSFSIGTEANSGTDPNSDGTEENTFNSYLAAKHKFFGLMDYFIDMKRGANNLGVHNYNAKINFNPSESKFTLGLEAYYFLSNQKSKTGNSDFGAELDIWVRYVLMKQVSVEWLVGTFLPGKLMEEIWTIVNKDGTKIIRNDPSLVSFLRFRVDF